MTAPARLGKEPPSTGLEILFDRGVRSPCLLTRDGGRGELPPRAPQERGQPVGFQNLQRIHMHDVGIAFVAFDLLRDGKPVAKVRVERRGLERIVRGRR